jgi:hypothetical protein
LALEVSDKVGDFLAGGGEQGFVLLEKGRERVSEIVKFGGCRMQA